MDDTTPKARQAYWDRLNQLTPTEKLDIALNLFETAHQLQRAAILHQNPNATESEILYQIALSRCHPAP